LNATWNTSTEEQLPTTQKLGSRNPFRRRSLQRTGDGSTQSGNHGVQSIPNPAIFGPSVQQERFESQQREASARTNPAHTPQVTSIEQNQAIRRRSQRLQRDFPPPPPTAPPPLPDDDGNSRVAEQECEACEACDQKSNNVSFCNVCNVRFCDVCWDMQFPHKNKKLGPRGDPHEKTPASVAAKVRKVLTPHSDPADRERLCKDDEETTWFGKQVLANSSWD
jgi:hypothetical protein